MGTYQKTFTRRDSTRGFSLVELLVALAIVALLTALVISSYSRGGQHEKIRSATAQVETALREAQSWGTYSRSFPAHATSTDRFDRGYGLFFQKGQRKIIIYGGNSTTSEEYFPSNNARIRSLPSETTVQDICVGTNLLHCSSVNTLRVFFRRPHLGPTIAPGASGGPEYPFAAVTIGIPGHLGDSSQRTIVIYHTGAFYIN